VALLTAFVRRLVWPALGLAAIAMLGACSSEDKSLGTVICPQAYMVKDATRLTDYAPGGGRDLIDIRYNAQIVDILWSCVYAVDDKFVDVDVQFYVRALRGPAADSPQTTFPYFVAVADPNGVVLAKQVFGIDIEFPGNSLEIGHVETVRQRIRYPNIASAADYNIFIGFQLTPEQLREARAFEQQQ
jgi:hypothetical protein